VIVTLYVHMVKAQSHGNSYVIAESISNMTVPGQNHQKSHH